MFGSTLSVVPGKLKLGIYVRKIFPKAVYTDLCLKMAKKQGFGGLSRLTGIF